MKVIGVTTVYGDEIAKSVAYQLLAEREPFESISHRLMPTWEEHDAFVERRPYPEWWAILATDDGAKVHMVGCTYVTERNEIGIGILKTYRRRGCAEAAIRFLLEQRQGRLLANINPHNAASVHLFRKLGFAGPIQHTYERRA